MTSPEPSPPEVAATAVAPPLSEPKSDPKSDPKLDPKPEVQAPKFNINDIKVTHITSLDCRILQYQYAITKLEIYIRSVREMSIKITGKTPTTMTSPEDGKSQDSLLSQDNASIESTTSTNTSTNTSTSTSTNIKPELKFETLPLVQYLVLLAGSMFSISDTSFNAKLELLSNFKLFKSTPINIPITTTHIPYDHPDTQVTALNELPTISLALKCLKSLEILCGHCLQGYRKRLAQAKIEQQKIYNTDRTNYYWALEQIIKKDIFNENLDIDLSLNDISFDLPKDSNLLDNGDFVEGSLVDMDIKMLFLINLKLRATLNDKLKPLIMKYKTIKHTPNKTVDKFALHKVFLLTIRLNELYTIFRKVGRKIYLSNIDHLSDSKFLLQLKNSNYFRTNYLTNLNDMLNSMKKNGTLIANLTRLVRQDSQFEVNIKNVNDLINFVNQGYFMLEGSIDKAILFGREWITAELRFRKAYQLPKKNLFDIYQTFKEEVTPQINIIPSTSIMSKTTSNSSSQKMNGSSSDLEAFPTVKSIDKNLKKLEINEKPTTRTSRSSSISSIGSNNSINSKPLLRKNSLTSPNRNSLLISPVNANTSSPTNSSKISPLRPRSNSQLFLNHNSSLTNIETSADTNSNNTLSPVIGRRRSNSQPIRSASSLMDEKIATSGAAVALTANNSLRSPSGSINRKQAPSPIGASKSMASPTPTNKNKKLVVVEEEEDSSPSKVIPKLTATQRYQQHLRQAAKSGSLMTQQREVLTSVTFDPNTPSATPLRKYIEVPTRDSVSISPEPLPMVTSPVPTTTSISSDIAAPKPRRTRDQVTKINTQRNSMTPQLDESETPSLTKSPSSSELSSSNNSSSNSTIKKVRFTGVPEYSAEEDAPTSYSHTILKNFAMFRNPIRVTAKPSTFKKKDQLLKKEESISFKKQVHQPLDDEVPTEHPAQIAAARSNGLSKIRNGI
ncbi:uncharacterized protein RJT21DRAFT_118572 [Scheffersomyces amazonensis]|uniref:uncharacterized protein n=1 Tax=Scheffersomyces amazonensis TaxID=1078765 RepID=UPI00315DFA42